MAGDKAEVTTGSELTLPPEAGQYRKTWEIRTSRTSLKEGQASGVLILKFSLVTEFFAF
jgi:hypothetical protein